MADAPSHGQVIKSGMSVFGSLALSYVLVPGETFQNRLRRDSLEDKSSKRKNSIV